MDTVRESPLLKLKLLLHDFLHLVYTVAPTAPKETWCCRSMSPLPGYHQTCCHTGSGSSGSQSAGCHCPSFTLHVLFVSLSLAASTLFVWVSSGGDRAFEVPTCRVVSTTVDMQRKRRGHVTLCQGLELGLVSLVSVKG